MQEAVRLISLERSAACRHILICLRCGSGLDRIQRRLTRARRRLKLDIAPSRRVAGAAGNLSTKLYGQRCFYLLLCIGAGPVTNAVSGPPSVRRDRFERHLLLTQSELALWRACGGR